MARPGLEKNPKFKRLVRTLGIPKPYCRGLLDTLWEVAYECGNPVIGDPEAIEAAAEWPGEPGKLFEALLNAGGSGRTGFIEDAGDGCYQIHDLFDHAPDYVKKRRAREEKRQSKSKNGGQRRTTADNGAEMRSAADNGNTPAPAPTPIKKEEDKSSSRRRQPEPSPEDFELAEHMVSKVAALTPNALGMRPAQKPITISKWAQDIRLMREQDGRAPPEIKRVFDWANRDTFWQANIRSAAKLREQFDQLVLRMKQGHGGSARDNSEVTARGRERSL